MNLSLLDNETISKFMDMAKKESHNSPCKRLRVGAAIVESEKMYLLSLTHNRTLFGKLHICQETGCKDIIHAETDALSNVSSRSEFGIFITHEPCYLCAQEIIKRHCQFVVYKNSYSSLSGQGSGLELLRKANIFVAQYHD